MKKLNLWVLIIVVTFSLVFIGAGCKAEGTPPKEETTTEEVTTKEEASTSEESTLEETTEVSAGNGNIDWKQFSGKTISVLFSTHPWQEAVEPFIPDFEKLTGIKVNVTKLPEAQMATKAPAEMTAGTFAYDVFMTQYLTAPIFAREHWTADLSTFLEDDKLTDPEWFNWEDFFPNAQAIATAGNTYFQMIPITAEGPVQIYRTDIYEELRLSVPKTFDELLANVKTISENTDIAGITLRGGPFLYSPLYGVLRSYGGGYFDNEFNPIISSPESIEGAKMYLELCKYAPPGITQYDWDEINTVMLAGKAATFLDSSIIYPRLQDPEKSTIIGKFKVAPYPEGPAGSKPQCQYWALSVYEGSENKEAAWLFVEWVTSKEVMHQLALKGILPPRTSIWDESDFKKAYPEDFITSVRKSLETGEIYPVHPRFYQLMDMLRAEVQSALLGEKTIEDALNSTQEQWKQVLSEQ